MLFNTKKMKGKDVLGIFGWRGSVGQDKIGSSRIGNGQQDRLGRQVAYMGQIEEYLPRGSRRARREEKIFYHRGHGGAQREEEILMVTEIERILFFDKHEKIDIRWIPACAGMTEVSPAAMGIK